MKRKLSAAPTNDEAIPFLEESMATSIQSLKQEEHSVTAGQIRWLLNHCKKEKFYMALAFGAIAIASGTIMHIIC